MDKNLRKLQLCELEILKKFVKLCEENNLTYYISGGTFLGAVRHKGFIPWDDDVDVAMPREDYEKFLKLAKKSSSFTIKNFKYNDDYHLYHTRLTDDSIKVVSKSASVAQVWDAWIDVFPIDGLPNNFIIRQFFKLGLLEKKLLLKFSCFNEMVDLTAKRNLIKKIFIFIGKHVNVQKYMNASKRFTLLDKKLKKYSNSKSKYYMNFMGAYEFNSIMRKDVYYQDGAYYDFEGLKLFGPKNYDAYLTKIYGDYMTIPKNKNKHNTEIVKGDK